MRAAGEPRVGFCDGSQKNEGHVRWEDWCAEIRTCEQRQSLQGEWHLSLLERYETTYLVATEQDWHLHATISRGGAGGTIVCGNRGAERYLASDVVSFEIADGRNPRNGFSYTRQDPHSSSSMTYVVPASHFDNAVEMPGWRWLKSAWKAVASGFSDM